MEINKKKKKFSYRAIEIQDDAIAKISFKSLNSNRLKVQSKLSKIRFDSMQSRADNPEHD